MDWRLLGFYTTRGVRRIQPIQPPTLVVKERSIDPRVPHRDQRGALHRSSAFTQVLGCRVHTAHPNRSPSQGGLAKPNSKPNPTQESYASPHDNPCPNRTLQLISSASLNAAAHRRSFPTGPVDGRSALSLAIAYRFDRRYDTLCTSCASHAPPTHLRMDRYTHSVKFVSECGHGTGMDICMHAGAQHACTQERRAHLGFVERHLQHGGLDGGEHRVSAAAGAVAQLAQNLRRAFLAGLGELLRRRRGALWLPTPT